MPLRERLGMQIMFVRGESPGRLLDIGCGVGFFLRTMRELGWDVLGVELDPNTAALAQRAFGLRIISGSLEDANLPADSIDVITMGHVIEHITNPEAVLKEARRILKPGGRIVILTPNIESFGRRIFGSSWQHLSPPYHVQLFSMQGLLFMTREIGFEPTEIRTSARCARQTWMESITCRQEKGARPWYSQLLHTCSSFTFQALEAVACRIARNTGEELVFQGIKV